MASLVRGITSAALRIPALTVVLVLLLTGVLGFFAGQSEQDQGQESFSPDNEALTASEFASEAFEGSPATIVQVVVEGDDVVSPEGLQTVTAVREAVTSAFPDRLSADRGAPVVSYLLPVEQAIAQGVVDPATLTDDAAVDAAYEQAVTQLPPEATGISSGLVATADGQIAPVDAETALLLVFLDTAAITEGAEGVDAETAALIGAVRDVVEVVDEVDTPLDTSAFAFELLFEADESFNEEIARLFATAAGIIVLILLLVYLFPPRGDATRFSTLRRAGADVLLTMFAILASISWMQGIGVLLGPDYLGVIGAFTPPTQIIPILLIGLGVDYAIHMTTRYREEIAEGDPDVDHAWRRAAGTVGVALLLATMTTALGFLTNVVNPVPAIQDFGVLAAIGITVAFLLMLTFVPAARSLLDRRAGGALPREALGATAEGRLSNITAATAVLGERFAVPVVIVTVLAAGLGGYGLTQLSTEFSFTDFLPEDNPVLATFDTIEEEFSGGFGEQTTIVAQGDPATPAAHNATVAAVGELADVEGVLTVGENAAAESLVSKLGQQLQLAQLGQQLQAGGGAAAGGEGDAGGQAPPGAPDVDPAQLQAAGQFAQTATGLGLQPDLTVADDADVAAIYDALLAADPTTASILATGDDGGYVGSLVIAQTQSDEVGALTLAENIESTFAPVEEALAPVDGEEPRVTATGTNIITQAIITDLSASQVSSLAVTLLAALVLLVLVFGIRDRRPVLGALTLLPVGFVLLWVFGMMAATGIPFGPVTSTISGLAIGIGVPFTIHITNRFTEDLEVYGEVDGALRSTLRHTGGALAGSALTTMAGFIILVTSSLTPFRQLGLVVAYAIGFSLVAAILVLPSLLALWARSASTPELHHEEVPATTA